MKVEIDKREALADIMRRANSNRNGVMMFLQQGGVTPQGDTITVADLRQLHQVNKQAFNNTIAFLYPEVFGGAANAEGEEEAATGTKKGLSESDKQGIFNLAGGIIDTAGDVLGKWLSGSDKTAADILGRWREDEKTEKANTRIWIGIIAGIVCVVAVIAFIATRPAMHVTKV